MRWCEWTDARRAPGFLRRFHGSESGAVALLCLAGTLIIFMTALMMFDSGWATQEKLRTQTSSDSAAYSNAAVKARAMNSIAYMNVVKRSLVGMFEMYVGMMYFFRLELDKTLECLATVTEELVDYEAELAEFEGEMDSWREDCDSDDGGGGGGGGPGNKKEAKGGGGDGCDGDGRPDAPKAPATTICPGCEIVEGTSPYEGVTMPDYSVFGIDMNSILNAIVLATSEQTCPIKDIFDAEALGDWQKFAATDAYELTPGPYGTYDDAMDGTVTRFIRINLRSLTDFQEIMIVHAPEWGAAEAQQRARFSGAHEVILPEEPSALPLRKGRWLDLCLSKQGHVDSNNKTGEALRREIQANIEAHTIYSHPDSGFNPDDDLSQQGAEYMDAPGCRAAVRSLHSADSDRLQAALQELLAGNMAGYRAAMADLREGSIGDDRGHMFPWHAREDYVHDMFATGRKSKLTTGYARGKFSFMTEDYANPEEYQPELYEGMSCGEAVNLDPTYGMWRSSWGARIAPVEECDDEMFLHWK